MVECIPGLTRIAVLLGGISGEREVSLVSGQTCVNALREKGYEVVAIDAGRDLAERLNEARPDVVLNMLHGRWGEDGCVQGLLETLKIPYSHSGVLASALAMDKTRSKALLREVNIPVPEGKLVSAAEIALAHPMRPPYVIKPNDGGSSIGVMMVHEGPPPTVVEEEAGKPCLVEPYVAGLELTVGICDNQPIEITEIVPPESGWYDYQAKYAAGVSTHILPARIPEKTRAICLDLAGKAHAVLGCRGVSRADFRYDAELDRLVLLELNTQPGMTPTSLVPEQAEYHGMPFVDLLQWMVEDASCGR